MELKDNPLLQPENYAAGYKDNIESLRNNPDFVDFEKLCYELFEANEMGKKFMELVKERYLIPPGAEVEQSNYTTKVIWSEGFKDFPRMLLSLINSRKKRIQAEMNK